MRASCTDSSRSNLIIQEEDFANDQDELIEKLQQKVNFQQKEIDMMRYKLKNLIEQSKEKDRKIADIATIELQNDQYYFKVENQNSQITELQKLVKSLKLENEHYKENTQRDLQSQNNKNELIKLEVAGLQEQLNKSQKYIQKMQTDIQRQNKYIEDIENQYESTIKDLQMENVRLQKLCEETIREAKIKVEKSLNRSYAIKINDFDDQNELQLSPDLQQWMEVSKPFDQQQQDFDEGDYLEQQRMQVKPKRRQRDDNRLRQSPELRNISKKVADDINFEMEQKAKQQQSRNGPNDDQMYSKNSPQSLLKVTALGIVQNELKQSPTLKEIKQNLQREGSPSTIIKRSSIFANQFNQSQALKQSNMLLKQSISQIVLEQQNQNKEIDKFRQEQEKKIQNLKNKRNSIVSRDIDIQNELKQSKLLLKQADQEMENIDSEIQALKQKQLLKRQTNTNKAGSIFGKNKLRIDEGNIQQKRTQHDEKSQYELDI